MGSFDFESGFKSFVSLIMFVVVISILLSFFVYAGIGAAAWAIASHYLNM